MSAETTTTVQVEAIPAPAKTDSVTPVPPAATKSAWVRFEDETGETGANNKSSAQQNGKVEEQPAVINTESIQVNLDRSLTVGDTPLGGTNVETSKMRTVELPMSASAPQPHEIIQQGFCKLT